MRKLVPKLLREPLIHFLVLGAMLFLVFELSDETNPRDTRRIVVTENQIEKLTAQFERTWLREPTSDELDGLVNRYVREEIYYREAQAMGLGQNDPYVRNRLALKLKMLLNDLSAEVNPPDKELERFLAQHPDRFTQPPQLSFRQVYIDPDQHPNPAGEAQRLLGLLQGGADSDELGDVTMLAHGLDRAMPFEVSRQYGKQFFDGLEELETGAWQGPIRSSFGLHLVLISQRWPAYLPPLEKIRGAVLAEWREQRRRESSEKTYQRLRERYEVVTEAQKGNAGQLPEFAAGLPTDEGLGKP